MIREFVYSDLFDLLPQSFKVSKLDFVADGKTPAYSSDTTNNGRLGFVNREPLFRITSETPVYIVFGDHTRTMNIVHEDFCVMDNVKVLAPKESMTDEVILYITTSWKKAIPNFGYARHWSVAKDVKFQLPVVESSDPDHEYTVDDIDRQYMQDRIAELEQDRIAELEAYLIASGLDDYELTDEDKEILSLSSASAASEAGASEADCEHEWIRFKKFKIASSYIMRGKLVEVDECGIFNIFPTKEKINANKIHFGGTHPYVARGSSNNGIRGYIDYDEKALNPANTISFGQDTATMYYQSEPYFTGDKIQVFELNKRYGVLTENEALYLVRVMSKAFENFFWGQQSFAVDVIANIEINLPINSNNEIDFNFIERYINVIEKLAIADVVRYKNQVIATTKQVVVR